MAIGVKVGNSDREADQVAAVRTVIILLAIVCEIVIIVSSIHKWQDAQITVMFCWQS